MNRYLMILTIVVISCIVSCNSVHNKVSVEKNDLQVLQYLQDSLKIFQEVTEFEVKGELKGGSVKVNYFSISEDEFLSAIKRNNDNVRYFRKEVKVNENLEVANSSRLEQSLFLNGAYGCISLGNLEKNKFHRARNYFLENRIGDYFIVKREQFEDSETIFWNSKTGLEDLYLIGTSLCTQDSLVFYSSTFRITPEDKSPICIMKVNSGQIDTLLQRKVDWYTGFSFFDKEKAAVYYIHSFYEDYELKSTYAKMDIESL